MTLNVSIQVDGIEDAIRAAEKVGISAGRVIMAAIDAAGEVIEAEIASRAPGPHIEREPITSATAVDIGPDSEHFYYQFFEFGTEPHEIRPNTKQALAFGEHVVGGVNHPGMSKQPFMRPVVDDPPRSAGMAASTVLKSGIESGVE